MNVFNKVTIASLKKNKSRTIVTIIGIMLSTAMICAVTTCVYSFQTFLLENAIYMDGDWHGSVLSADRDTLEKIENSEEVAGLVYAEQVGYAIAEGCTNTSKPYLYIISASDGFEKSMPIHLTSGEYPKTDSEILLPSHLQSNGGITNQEGDTLTLGIGDRLEDGYILGQSNPYCEYDDDGNKISLEDSLNVRETKTYTVVGFYERPSFENYSAPGYTAITVNSNIGTGNYDIYFKMNKPEGVYAFMEENKLNGNTNFDVLLFSGVTLHSSFYAVLYGLLAIVIGLIMFGSVSLIYNAFSISVSERTKQFGLLSSIGATKKQLRGTVLFEAFAVSLIGIPLGISVGIGGIAVTLHFVGGLATSIANSYIIPLRLCVSFVSVIAAVVIALVTVLISAWIPSRRAMRVTAIEAIRQSLDIKASNKQVKTSKVIYKLFGLPGVIAAKHFKRNRKKYRTTVISLFMSIVLFVSASALTGYLVESVEGSMSSIDYDIVCYVNSPEEKDVTADELLSQFEEDPKITASTYYKYRNLWCDLSQNSLTETWMRDYSGVTVGAYGGANFAPEGQASVRTQILFIEDAEFKQLLDDNNLEESLYMNADEPLAVVYDQYKMYDYEKDKYLTGHILSNTNTAVNAKYPKEMEGYYLSGEFTDDDGNEICEYTSKTDEKDVISFPRDEVYISADIKLGAVIENKPYYVNNASHLVLIYPAGFEKAVLHGDSESTVNFIFRSDDHAESFTAIKRVLTSYKLPSKYVYDYAEDVEDTRNLITIIRVFSYGFVVLISLIAAANVFNTISTNISLRRREFAMLKSVGMTSKGFNKMMNFECLLYGTKALLYGLPVSCIITYLIYRAVAEGYSAGFHLPWAAIGIAVLSVFAVVFATMMYAMNKIKNDNPIDALKNENV